MSKKIYPLLALFLSVCVAFIMKCGEKQSREIKIGGIFDITGATREVSGAYADGIKLYIDYINKKGGIISLFFNPQPLQWL